VHEKGPHYPSLTSLPPLSPCQMSMFPHAHSSLRAHTLSLSSPNPLHSLTCPCCI
jgi:hypothetical protein